MNDNEKGPYLDQYGFPLHLSQNEKNGWLLNYEIYSNNQSTFVDFYFVSGTGGFRCTIPYFPTLLISTTDPDIHSEVINRKIENIYEITEITKTDTRDFNHLNSFSKFLKIKFKNETAFYKGRQELLKSEAVHESDIPFEVDVLIEHDLRCGKWYNVKYYEEQIYRINPIEDVRLPNLRTLAFDIECTKPPLKFPDANNDKIMMISLFVETESLENPGILIVNREIVCEDILDFEYFPKSDIGGHFKIFNETSEEGVLIKFIELLQLFTPHVITTYNGTFFDIPFLLTRAEKLFGIDGSKDEGRGIFSLFKSLLGLSIHLDSYKWVKRDSYLPMGSQGLKSVTKIKLGYFPDELNPEELTRLAIEDPLTLASYSVSDAVATFFLYKKYVQPFIFSLCTLIPLTPFNVLGKGSGSLCESLLIVEAKKMNLIVPPAKHSEQNALYKDKHIISSLNYVGGTVQALKTGIFRSDFDYEFKIEEVDFDFDEILKDYRDEMNGESQEAHYKNTNLDEGRTTDNMKDNYSIYTENLKLKLKHLSEKGSFKSKPLIYHLDVGAMYPNIILSNKLQPTSIVNDETCLRCDFYSSRSDCQKSLGWTERVEYYPPDAEDIENIVNKIRRDIKYEEEKTDVNSCSVVKKVKTNFEQNVHIKTMDTKRTDMKNSHTKKTHTKNTAAKISSSSSNAKILESDVFKKELIEHSRKHYKKMYKVDINEKDSIVCQREIPFYLNTVRKFRDQRYVYKKLAKSEKSKDLRFVYESLQVAHKVVLNSFYGYVMRRGSRWYSMEMAAIVCNQGGLIIKEAKNFISKIGVPLELDTDGIWCIIPSEFPSVVELKSGKKIQLIMLMLNNIIRSKYGADLIFEIDGPYHAMVLPSSTEENKLIKKKYVVFNHKKEITELKGFESKRRGELNFIKKFQDDLFMNFISGSSLTECYGNLKKICDYWFDIIKTKAASLDENDIFQLFSESKNMSKDYEEYEGRRALNTCTAKRLAEFLGQDMLKYGLKCEFIISKFPLKSSITNRAIPVEIFQASPDVKDKFLKKWLKSDEKNIREIIDWKYYEDRFNKIVLKMIILPGIAQGIPNQMKNIELPKWINKQKNTLLNYAVEKNKDKIKDTCISAKIADKTNKSCAPKITPNYLEYCKMTKEDWIRKFNESKIRWKEQIIGLEAHTNEIVIHKKLNKKITKEKMEIQPNVFVSTFISLDDSENESDIKFEADSEYETDKEIGRKIVGSDLKGFKSERKILSDTNKYISVYNIPKNDPLVKSILTKKVYEEDLESLSALSNFSNNNVLSVHFLTSFNYQKRVFYSLTETDTKFYCEGKHDLPNIYQVQNLVSLLKHTEIVVCNDKDLWEKVKAEKFSVLITTKTTHSLMDFNAILQYQKKLHEKMKRDFQSLLKINGIFNFPLLSHPLDTFEFLDCILYKMMKQYDLIIDNKMNLVNNSEISSIYPAFNTPGYYDYCCIEIECVGSFLLSILHSKIENRSDFIILKDLLKNVIDTKLVDSVEEWIKYKSRIISHSLKEILRMCQYEYLKGIVKEIQNLKFDIISANKEIIIIGTKKRDSVKEMINYIEKNINKKYEFISVNVIRRYEKMIFLNPLNYFFILDGKISAYCEISIPLEFLTKFFSNEPVPHSEFYSLIFKGPAFYDKVKMILNVLQTREEINELRATCYRLMNISEFEIERNINLNVDHFCTNCKTDMTIQINQRKCTKCFNNFDSLDVLFVKLGSALIDKLNEYNCILCKSKREMKLKRICRCGGSYQKRRFEEWKLLKEFGRGEAWSQFVEKNDKKFRE